MEYKRTRLVNFVYSFIAIIPLLSYGYYRLFNRSSGSSMGVFAYADASGYKSCIESLSIFSTFGGLQDFCFRRPIYPFAGGIVLKIVNDPLLVPLVFSVMFSISVIFLIIELRNHFDFLPIMSSAFFLVFQWHVFASISFTTEALGLTLGVIATTLIFKSIRIEVWQTYFYAGLLIGLSQLVRPGNLFLILFPCIFLLIHHSGRINVWKKCLVVFSSVLPFLFIRFLASALKVPSLNSSGNFWGVLYGLSDGNKTWAAAYELPGIQPSLSDSQIWKIVKEATIQNIYSNPTEFLNNIFSNVWRYIEYRLTFVHSAFGEALSPLSNFAYFLFVALISFSIVIFLIWSTTALRLLNVFILISSILTFGIFYNAEPFRTISTFHFLFILTLFNSTYFVFKRVVSKSKLIEFANKVRESIPESKTDGVGQYIHERDISSIKVTSFILMATISLGIYFKVSQFKEWNLAPIRLCLNDSSIPLQPDSLQIVDLHSIEKPPRYLWSPILKRLEPGVLVHGLYRDKTGFIGTVNAYVPSSVENLAEMAKTGGCLKIVPDRTPERQLWIIGLKLALIEKSN